MKGKKHVLAGQDGSKDVRKKSKVFKKTWKKQKGRVKKKNEWG